MTTTIIDHNPITDMMDPRLDAWRPDPEIVGEYVSRTFPGGYTDIEIGLEYWKVRQNLLLVGDTQAGKSMFFRVLAVLAAKDAGHPKPLPIFTLSGSNGVTDYDLHGQTTAWLDPETGEEKLVHLPGVPDIAARVGGILELDEVAMLPERVTSSLHPLCDDRRQFVNRGRAVKVENDGFMPDIVKASEDLWVVGSYNDGYRGSGHLQEAFTNRFVHLPWGYDDAVEEKLISSPTIRVLGKALRASTEARRLTTPCGTKALMVFEDTFRRHGAEFAIWSFLGMFPSKDRSVAQVILADRDFKALLDDEFTQLSSDDLSDLLGGD